MPETLKIIHIDKNKDAKIYKSLNKLLGIENELFFKNKNSWLEIKRGKWTNTNDKKTIITIEHGQSAT